MRVAQFPLKEPQAQTPPPVPAAALTATAPVR